MESTIRYRILKNKYVAISFSNILSKNALILCQVAQYATNRLSMSREYVDLLRNMIMRLGEFCRNIFIVLQKRDDIINCYLVLYLRSLLSRSLKDKIRQAIAWLESFAELSGIRFTFMDYKSIRSLLSFLTTKKRVTWYSGGMEILPSGGNKSAFAPKNISFYGALARYSVDTVDLNLLSSDFIHNGRFIIFGLDSYSLRTAVSRAMGRTLNKYAIMNNGLSREAYPRDQLYQVKVRIILGSGGEITEITSMSTSSDSSEKIMWLPMAVIPHRIRYNVMRNNDCGLLTLFRVFIDEKPHITIKADIEVLTYFISLLFHILMLAKKRRIYMPVLDIQDEATKGEIHIGWQLQSGEPIAPFYLKLVDIQRHILILGRTGMGKSRLARIIVEGLLAEQYSKVWIFDFHREYIDLASRYGFEVFIPGTLEYPLMINIFESIGENPESYSTFLMSLLLETIKLRGGEVSAQMERALSYALWSTVTGDEPSPLTFLRNLLKWCKEVESDLPTALYTFYAVINRLKSIFSGISRNIFWVKRSNIHINELRNKNVIFDLSFLFKRNLKREILLLINVLLRYLVMDMFREGINNNNRPKLCLVVEEGRYLMPWRRMESSMETTAMEDFATLARKYGLGLVVISQSPYTISPDIISNAGTLFMMNAEIPEHEHIISGDEQLRRYIQIMPPREAIVRLTSSPALIHIRVREIEPDLASEPIIQRSRREDTERYLIEIPFEEYIKSILT